MAPGMRRVTNSPIPREVQPVGCAFCSRRAGPGVWFIINNPLIALFPLPEVQRPGFTRGVHPPDREDGAHRLPREQPSRAGTFGGRICQLAGFSQD